MREQGVLEEVPARRARRWTSRSGLQGSVIIGQMLAGKQQIGYLGDMPAIVGASKRLDARPADRRHAGHSPGPVRASSSPAPTRPDFADQAAAIKWFDGKTSPRPQGSCTDRIAQATFKQQGVEAEGVPQPEHST